MKKTSFIAMCVITMLSFSCKKKEIYQDACQPIEARVEDLLSKMTLDEKLSIIGGDSTGFSTNGVERLGIPQLLLSDGPIGVRTGMATSFPSAVSYAASWDTTLINELAIAMGKETRAKGKNYLLGPCVCINRMPLSGRNFESYGEDPYLTSRLAVNYVKGLQSQNVISSVKHYAMNDQEWERNYYDVQIDERTMREIHLPAFEAAVTEADAWSVMSAYNIVNGQHCSENYQLLGDILKKDWKFQGFVVSDWVSVYGTEHPANAGLDLEMPTSLYFKADSIKKYMALGKITEDVINDKVRRLLRVRFKAGLFEAQPKADTSVLHSEAHKALTLKAAEKSITLLKNDGILPLNKENLNSIAIIGPNAQVCRAGGGGSSYVTPYYSVSPFDGIKTIVGEKVKLNFAQGTQITGFKINTIQPSVLFLPDGKTSGLKAEFFNNMELKGTPAVTITDTTINHIWSTNAPVNGVTNDTFSVRWTGKINITETKDYRFDLVSDDGVRLFIDGKQLVNNWTNHGATLDFASVKLSKGLHDIKLEYFDSWQGATIQLGWNNVPQVEDNSSIDFAVNVAKNSDIAIVFAGSAGEIESEGQDRAGLDLPEHQDDLFAAVVAANPNTIVVLNGGTPVKVDKWIKQVKGLINMYYSGQETGTAIANILFGKVNPSGKLPFSFIANESQSPAFNGYKDLSLKIPYSEGVFVGYRYIDKNKIEPAYPFGFGLSYTSFEYSDVKISDLGDKNYEVTATIKNTGKVDGEEIVQLYIAPQNASCQRPVKELKAFSKVALKSGESKTVNLKLNSRSFAHWDLATKGWKVDAGDYEIQIGASSANILLKQNLTIK